MSLLSIGKTVLRKMDLFASMQFLRFKHDAQTKTMTGGFISFGIMLVLAITFSTMIFETFNKLLINAVINETQEPEPPSVIFTTRNGGKKFMLGFELWLYDLCTGPRYFDITVVNSVLQQGLYSNATVEYKFEPCTKQHWTGLQNHQEVFDRNQMNTWLCLPLDIDIVVSGKYSSPIQRSMDITVSACKNETDPSRPCASPQEIDAFMKSNSQFYWTPYFLNPLLNPQSADYLKYYLQDKYYVMSGINYGSELYIYNDDFQITTDQSIFPFSQIHSDFGPIVNQVRSNTYMLDNTTDIYVLMNFFRGPQSLIIQRNYEKIVDALAYVGGLLGSFLLLLIVVNFYNEHSYEMNFAEALYAPEEGSPTHFKKYNILYYLMQSIYGVLKTFNINCEWKNVQFFHKTRQEMIRQLDVMLLFKKINILENAMMALLSKQQLRGIMLKTEMTVSEVRNIRKLYNLKKEIVKLAHRKLHKPQSEQELKGPMDSKVNTSNFDLAINFNKNLSEAENPGTLNETREDPRDNPDLNLDDFPSESQSSEEDEAEKDKREEELLRELRQLRQEALQNNVVSKSIFKNIDPRMKRVLQRYVGLSFDLNQEEKGDPDLLEVPYQDQFKQTGNNFHRVRVTRGGSRRRIVPEKNESVNEPSQKIDYDFTYLNP